MNLQLRLRPLLLSIAFASGVACVSSAFAQNNDAAPANGAAAAPAGGGAGAAPKLSAAQRMRADQLSLLGGPQAARDGYGVDATPDAQRAALLDDNRMRIATPNTQAAGGPTTAGDGQPAPVGRAKRPARGGAAAAGANGPDGPNGGAGAGAQKPGAINAANAGTPATAVYGSPYGAGKGRDAYRMPW